MADIPKTRQAVAAKEAARLRDFTRTAQLMNGRIAGARVAQREDAAALAGLLCHESIGHIEDHLKQRARGDCILFASFNAAGEATAYFDVELWPQWSVAKFGGAVKAERQGRGFGSACGLAAV